MQFSWKRLEKLIGDNRKSPSVTASPCQLPLGGSHLGALLCKRCTVNFPRSAQSFARKTLQIVTYVTIYSFYCVKRMRSAALHQPPTRDYCSKSPSEREATTKSSEKVSRFLPTRLSNHLHNKTKKAVLKLEFQHCL